MCIRDRYCREELDANPNAFEDGSMTFSSESVKKGLEKFKYMWDQGWFPESGLTGNRETMQQLFVPVSYTHLDVYKRQVKKKQTPLEASFCKAFSAVLLRFNR